MSDDCSKTIVPESRVACDQPALGRPTGEGATEGVKNSLCCFVARCCPSGNHTTAKRRCCVSLEHRDGSGGKHAQIEGRREAVHSCESANGSLRLRSDKPPSRCRRMTEFPRSLSEDKSAGRECYSQRTREKHSAANWQARRALVLQGFQSVRDVRDGLCQAGCGGDVRASDGKHIQTHCPISPRTANQEGNFPT